MPSSWLPSRSVVSYTSTRAGVRFASGLFVDMVEPVLVAVVLAADRGEVPVLQLLGDRARLAELAVVHRADGNHLGRRAGQEGLVGGVEVAAEQVLDLVAEAEVGGDRADRVLGDALERAGRDRRRD